MFQETSYKYLQKDKSTIKMSQRLKAKSHKAFKVFGFMSGSLKNSKMTSTVISSRFFLSTSTDDLHD